MENDILVSITIGVISGIFTSIFIWIVVKFFNSTILPWYQSLIYKGQDISGEWEGYYQTISGDGKQQMEQCSLVNIKQKGSFINGSFVLIKQPNGKKCNKEYSFAGTLYNNSLVISYDITDRTRVGRGSFVFYLEDDGQKLNGFLVGINAYAPGVISTSSYWIRKKD